jgi:hypothetical protein
MNVEQEKLKRAMEPISMRNYGEQVARFTLDGVGRGGLPQDFSVKPGEAVDVPRGYGEDTPKENGNFIPCAVRQLAPSMGRVADDPRELAVGKRK